MARSLTIAICVDGVDDEALIAAALPWIEIAEHVEVWCGYSDEAARELDHLRERHGRPRLPHGPPHGPPPPHRDEGPDGDQAQAIARRAVEVLREHNVGAGTRILSDRDAGHALAAASTPQTTLVLSSGHRGGIGPKSIGHVARFVIDHAAGPVVVLKV